MNMIQNAKDRIAELTLRAYEEAAAAGELPAGVETPVAVEIPKDAANGDYTTTFCLAAAKAMRKPPREVAQILTGHMRLEGSWFTGVEIAGPGFLNFRLGDRWYADVLAAVDAERADYGRSEGLRGVKYMVEFVSANPTGPMHMGNARGGVLGDTLAGVLAWNGATVEREFYVNDAGNQVDKFGRSIEARYVQLLKGEDAVEFPEDGYKGEDIWDLAREIIAEYGDKYLNTPTEERRQIFEDYGLPKNIALMKQHLERYRIRFDNWFLESSLHESGYVAETVELLTRGGHTYEKDGALWLRNTALGAEKDEVLRRSNGFYTYYAVDLAYHRNKFVERGFDRVIDVWGADHHGHAIRFGKSMTAPELGLQGKRLDFLIMQMVRLVRDGETVKVSKRSGKALTLNDLLDEIGVDACRFFFNAKPDTHLEFDLDLAVRQDSENPVYYVQYAHARICSLLATLAAEGHPVPAAEEADAALLTAPQELELIKQLAAFPEEIQLAARDYDPSRINRFAVELAARFHRFYNACRIRDAEPEVQKARLVLSQAAGTVIAAALAVLGVSAPEKM